MHKDIKQAINYLKDGALVLIPTDTYWSIACDAENNEAVQKLMALTTIKNSIEITCFVADDRMLKKYVKYFPSVAQNIIDIADTPTTIIYDNPQNIAKNLITVNNTIAISIPDHEFCYQLSRKLNGAIAISSAKASGNSAPKSFKEISPSILKNVAYVVNLQKEKICLKPAAIIQIKNNGIVKVLRK